MEVSSMTRRTARWSLALAASALLFLLLWSLAGCAVGRSATGEAVLGITAGWHPDADRASVAAGTIGSMLFGPAGGTAAVGLVGALAGLFGWSRQRARAERAEGRHDGWDEREAAARGAAPVTLDQPRNEGA